MYVNTGALVGVLSGGPTVIALKLETNGSRVSNLLKIPHWRINES